MDSKNHQAANEDQLAEDLDAFLAAQLNGQITVVPTSLPLYEANLTIELTTLAKATQPDTTFAADLEARLLQAEESEPNGFFLFVTRKWCCHSGA